MPSSPMLAAARSQYLVDLLSQVPDPRSRRGIRHPLGGLLAMGIAAVVAGSRSFAAIGQWAADAGGDVLAALGAARGAPDERVMATLRSLAISLLHLDGHKNIAAANRHHARDPQRTLKLLQST